MKTKRLMLTLAEVEYTDGIVTNSVTLVAVLVPRGAEFTLLKAAADLEISPENNIEPAI